jgi:hypothetical protein
MAHSTSSNVIIGSKLALAMSVAVGSPVRRNLGTIYCLKSVEYKEMDRHCEELKNRSLKLLSGLRAEETLIASESANTRSSANRKAARRIGKVMKKMMQQQTSLHSRMEKLLDSMLLQIGGNQHSNS